MIKIIRGMLTAISIMTFAGSMPAVSGVFPMAVVQAAEENEAAWGTAVIQADSLNVRSGPGRDYDVISSVKSGQEFMITGESENGWYPIDLGGAKGYVSGEYIEIVPAQTGESNSEETQEELQEEIEEEEERGPIPGLPGVWQKITAAGPAAVAACVLIPIVLIGICFTVKGMLRRDEDEYDDGEEYYDTDYDDDDTDYDEDYDEEFGEEELYEDASVYGEDALYDEEPYLTDDAQEDYKSAEQIMAECTENFKREFAEAEQRKRAKARGSK